MKKILTAEFKHETNSFSTYLTDMEKYKERSIEVIVDVSRSKACEVLNDYAEKGGQIY